MQAEQLEHCCASQRWVALMLAQGPFDDEQSALAAAQKAEQQLNEDDWLEAFAGHPQIGDLASLQEKYAATRDLAGQEQAGVNSADQAILETLARANAAYQEKFGFIFIVCATGKTAAQMLDLLEQRLPNSREEEIRNAAREQALITRIRLKQLLTLSSAD